MMAASVARPLHMSGRIPLAILFVLGALAASNDVYTVISYASYASVGSILILRRPANAIGWLLLAAAWTFVGTTAAPLDIAALNARRAGVYDTLMAWLGGWTGSAWFVTYFALAVLFPSGHLPTGRWRRPVIALLVFGVVAMAVSAFAPTVVLTQGDGSEIDVPNPVAILPDLPIWALPGVELIVVGGTLALVVIGAISLLVRYRRATGIVRLQLRWLVAALAFVSLGLATGFTLLLALQSDAGWYVALVSFPTVPLAIGVAVLRYRLYELDRLVSRTIGWLLVTAVVVGLFAVAVIGLQALLEPVTEGSTLAVAVSTLLAAAAFQPLRQRIQAIVDRRFDRARYDGARLADAFSDRLRDEIDLEALAGALVGAAVSATRPASASVWLPTRGHR